MRRTREERQVDLASVDAAPVRGIHARDAKELAQAQADAETRLGRALTRGEKRIDIVAMDRDLTTGKAALHAAVAAEQRRAADAYTRDGTPIQLKVTSEMRTAISDLYDAGADHARRELQAAGITPA